MFRKTITRLAYSPSLTEELSEYARKLRHEESKRQVGLIFVVLALVIQAFAVLSPPESANAGNTADFMEGGFSTLDEYLTYYDHDTHNIKDFLTSRGISRADIQAARSTNLKVKSGLLVWTLKSRGDSGDSAYDFLKNDGVVKTVYYHPFDQVVTSHRMPAPDLRAAYVGYSSSAGWFALLKDSGNLVTKAVNSETCAVDRASSGTVPSSVSADDMAQCHAMLSPHISARNITIGTPASSQNAQPSDVIVYTLSVTNHESHTVSLPLSIGLADLLEYAQLIDKGGAKFNQESELLTWPQTSLSPGKSLTRNFIMKLLPTIPSTAVGQNNPSSYDCVMSTSFKETSRVAVACPFPKTVERIIRGLAPMSIRTNLFFAAFIAIIATYFYIRSRQLRTELRLIRHNHHGIL